MTTGTYLLHFDPPYRHARHYLGWSSSIEDRLGAHRAGRGARLVEVAMAAGSRVILVRTWPGTLRANERRLKGGSATWLCPICTPNAGRGRWPARELAPHRASVSPDALAGLAYPDDDGRCLACRLPVIVVAPRFDVRTGVAVRRGYAYHRPDFRGRRVARLAAILGTDAAADGRGSGRFQPGWEASGRARDVQQITPPQEAPKWSPPLPPVTPSTIESPRISPPAGTRT